MAIVRIGAVERKPANGRAASGIVTLGSRGIPAAGDGAPVGATARDRLPRAPIGACTMHRRGGVADRLQGYLVRAYAEELTEPTELGYLGCPPPALPEVDRLGLDAHPQRQLELGPSPFLP